MGKLTDFYLSQYDDWVPWFNNSQEKQCYKCKKKVHVWVKINQLFFCHTCINQVIINRSFNEKYEADYENKRFNQNINKRSNGVYSSLHKGVYFRSLFEKKVFALLSALNFEVWYEHKWINGYLPDFYLNDLKIWIELRGHSRRDDINKFINTIRNGILEGKPYTSNSNLLENENLEFEYYKNHGFNTFFSRQELEDQKLFKKNNLNKTQLDRYLVILPIQTNHHGHHTYEPCNYCTYIYDHKGNIATPILIRTKEKWSIIDDFDYEENKNLIDEGYYIYYYYFKGKSEVYLKNLKGNNKISVSKFLNKLDRQNHK